MKPRDIPALIISIAIPLAVGGIAGRATTSNLEPWYASLEKPIFQPPNYLFGPVWTLLYILMGISLYLIWKSPSGTARTKALGIFALQLALNFGWSFIFFSFQWLGAALAWIILLWVVIAIQIGIFLRVNKTAAYLQIPYLLWVTFATLLNAAIWRLN